MNAEAIKADYKNGVLELHIPKREEAKPKQIKVNVSSHGSGTQASGVQPTAAAAAAAGR